MAKRNNMMHKSILLLSGLAFAAQAADSTSLVARTEARMDSLAEYAASTVKGKDDTPVSVSGNLTTRVRNFHYDESSLLFSHDKARTYVDANLDLVLAATPNSYVNFWTILNFPFDFSGYYANEKACSPNQNPGDQACKANYHHHVDYYSSTLWEDATAGIDVRGGSFGAMVKAGGVLWANSSPLTMWEREAWPKFPSTYETFEEERTVSTYYKEKSFRPVMEGGRAFWTNRSFAGILMEIYQMPFGLSGQLMYSQPKDNDLGTRDGLRLLAGQPGEVEMSGTLDFRGDVYHARLAKKDIGPMMLGLNFLSMSTDRDVVYEPGFVGSFGTDTAYFNDYRVASIDVKGNITPALYLMLDVAASQDDSTVFKKVATGDGYEQDEYRSATSDPALAVYAKVQSKHWEPITVEGVFIQDDFYSPYGMTDYSRNRTWRKNQMPLGAGAFRYSPNLMGLNFKLEPNFNRGRFNVLYSQHRQYKEGLDILTFPYRLNGRQMWETTNAWSKYNTALFMDEAAGQDATRRYASRIGGASGRKLEDQRGGLRGGTWEVWEYVGIFDNVEQAMAIDVPEHKKWSSAVSFDMGYDIGHWFGTDRSIMMAANTALSGISTSVAPIAYSESQSGMMLWSFFFQAEPTFAITPNLHGLLIGGIETFRAENVYGKTTWATGVETYGKMPVNYLETALGFGFDWDFAPRAGLHLRYKRATHSDELNSDNNWKAHLVTAETKVWF